MKTFYRTYLPESIKYNGKIYGRYNEVSDDFVIVKVLSRNLKGRTDLYGHPYKPTAHKLYKESKWMKNVF